MRLWLLCAIQMTSSKSSDSSFIDHIEGIGNIGTYFSISNDSAKEQEERKAEANSFRIEDYFLIFETARVCFGRNMPIATLETSQL